MTAWEYLVLMVYFWTYAHPLYTAHPTYKHVVLTAVVGPMHCRSDGHCRSDLRKMPIGWSDGQEDMPIRTTAVVGQMLL